MPNRLGNSIFIILLVSVVAAFILVTQQQNVNTKSRYTEAISSELKLPQQVINAVNLEPGMNVGEIGFGADRFTFDLAERVGKDGKIYAVDNDHASFRRLITRYRQSGLTNITIINGEDAKPDFPENSLDMIFVSDVYHYVTCFGDLLTKCRIALKPEGTLVILVRGTETASDTSNYSAMKVSLLHQVRETGYELIRTNALLKEDNFYVFRVGDDKL